MLETKGSCYAFLETTIILLCCVIKLKMFLALWCFRIKQPGTERGLKARHITYVPHLTFSTTYNLSVSDVVEDSLERLCLEHHVLDEVHVEVVEVHLPNRVSKLVLESVHLVLQSPHLPEGSGII